MTSLKHNQWDVEIKVYESKNDNIYQITRHIQRSKQNLAAQLFQVSLPSGDWKSCVKDVPGTAESRDQLPLQFVSLTQWRVSAGFVRPPVCVSVEPTVGKSRVLYRQEVTWTIHVLCDLFICISTSFALRLTLVIATTLYVTVVCWG